MCDIDSTDATQNGQIPTIGGIIFKTASLSLIFNLFCKMNQIKISTRDGARPFQAKPAKGLLYKSERGKI